MKVGLLYPSSNTHPGIAFDFTDGLNALLNHKGITSSITLVKESIGFGAMEKEIYLKTEKMLMNDDADVLVIFADEKITELLYPLVMASGKLLVVVNTGANYPHNWIPQPGIIHISLQHAFLCRLAGGIAAQNGNGFAAYTSTYYDCGYLHGAAIVKQLMMKGGQIRFNDINRNKYDDSFEINALTQFLNGDPLCSNLLCVYDTLPAQLFYQRLMNYQPGRMLHLFVSPMMLEPAAVAAFSNATGFSVTGFTPWYKELPLAENAVFVQQCKRPATIFSLLGWETGLLLNELLAKNAYQDHETALDLLKQTPLASPRGNMQLDAVTQFYTAPITQFTFEAGNPAPHTRYITDYSSEWNDFTSEEVDGHVTGWTNTYLCY